TSVKNSRGPDSPASGRSRPSDSNHCWDYSRYLGPGPGGFSASMIRKESDCMAKIQAVWAIDIGQAALKALKLVPGENPDQVVAEAFDFIEYPKILSQPDADPDELVREALATFTDRNEVKGCKVAIAVPGQSGLVKFIKLPPVEKKRIPDIV